MRFLLSMFVVMLCISSFAQEKGGLRYSYLKPFVNLSVTAGTGSGHAYFALPSADLRFGRYTFSVSGLVLKKSSSVALQMEADVYFFETGKYVNSISLALGGQDIGDYPWTPTTNSIGFFYGLAGYNLYSRKYPTHLGFKLGIADYIKTESGKDVHRTIPYGSVSYRVFLIQPNLKVMPFKQAARRLRDTLFAKYFNPGISYGLGGASMIPILPAFSLRSGIFTFESGVSLNPVLLGLMSCNQLKADVYKIKETEKTRRYFTATIGVIQPGDLGDETFTYLMPGWNVAWKKRPFVFDFKLGAGLHHQEEEIYIYPYGQLSFGLHLFTFIE